MIAQTVHFFSEEGRGIVLPIDPLWCVSFYKRMLEQQDHLCRSRVWCLTINNYTDEDEQAFLSPKIKYYVYGREVGESGTPHLQAYVVLCNPIALTALKKGLFPRAHLEVRRGTHEQARDYCIKDGDFEEGGTPPISKKRQGEMGGEVVTQAWEEAWDLAKRGKLEDIKEPLRTRFYRTYLAVRKDFQEMPPSTDELVNEWYYGDSGSGKSRKAREDNPGAYIKPCNKWWDGYDGQEVVIIDEWGPVHEKLATHLKQWADHHPFPAEIKGGMLCIRPKKIIVTSNYSIEQCFSGDIEGSILPIKRRFKATRFSLLRSKPEAVTGFEQFLKK